MQVYADRTKYALLSLIKTVTVRLEPLVLSNISKDSKCSDDIVRMRRIILHMRDNIFFFLAIITQMIPTLFVLSENSTNSCNLVSVWKTKQVIILNKTKRNKTEQIKTNKRKNWL